MNLIISGASGFVGANLLDNLFEKNVDTYEKIILVDILQYGIQKISKKVLEHPKVKFINGSIYDSEILASVLNRGDAMIHLAVEENTFNNPQDKSTLDIENFVHEIADKKLDRFIFMSTANVYGHNGNSENIIETDPTVPTTVYAANKVAFEAYIQAHYHLNKLKAIIFRPVTIYGPKQFPGWLIPRTITKVMHNETIQLTGDGSNCRDWIYVDDVCNAIELALRSTRDDIFGQVFNLGTGEEASSLEIVKHIIRKIGKSDDLIEFIAHRPGDIAREITKADKARAYFGWSSTIRYDKGLDRTIDWFEHNLQENS